MLLKRWTGAATITEHEDLVLLQLMLGVQLAQLDEPEVGPVFPKPDPHAAARAVPTAFVYCEPGESEAMLSVCAALGARVPEDISLVFCEISDGLPITPNSSRIEASAIEAGRSAVALLMDVAHQDKPAPRSTLVAPRVIEGKTAGKTKERAGCERNKEWQTQT